MSDDPFFCAVPEMRKGILLSFYKKNSDFFSEKVSRYLHHHRFKRKDVES